MIQLENEIIVLSLETVSKLIDINPDSATLYLFYHKASKLQCTNQPWATNPFCMKGLKWGEKRLLTSKNILKDLGLIEMIREHTKNGDFGKSYIKITYLKTSALPIDSSTPSKQAVRKEGSNALSSKKINALSSLKPNALKKIDKKEKYLDFVFLTEDEFKKLLEKYPLPEINEKIENLNNYIGSTGKKYKSHYHTILSWSRKEKSTPSSANPPKKEMSEGQKVYLVQQRAALYQKIKDGIETMQDMSMTQENIKTQLNKSFGAESLSLNINIDEFFNNGNKNPQAGCLEIQQG